MDSEYAKALRILKNALVFGIKPSLEGIQKLTKALGDPHLKYPSIQIAGTNGKTSTARFTAAILRACGLKVGLYTSPELVHYEERIEVDGQVITRDDFAEAVIAASACAEELVARGELPAITEFELLTAAAFFHFAKQELDIAVLEVGMGGRWDATSVVNPLVAVITSVDLDHTAILGSTIGEIAAEKAAIIKPGVLVVFGAGIAGRVGVGENVGISESAGVGENVLIGGAAGIGENTGVSEAVLIGGTDGTTSAFAVFEQRIAETGAIIQKLPDSLPASILERFPSYQAANIACALAAASAALGRRIPEATLETALATLFIPGRLETLCAEPLLIIDAAHNPAAARALAATLKERFGASVPAILLLAVLADKDADGIIEALCPLFDRVAVTETKSSRALAVEDLAACVKKQFTGVVLSFATVEEALLELRASNVACIAAGSITLAGEVKSNTSRLWAEK